MPVKLKSDKQFARVATNLAIGVVGLLVVRLITQFLPMFHDAGWIVEDKLTVQAGAVIAVDALLLSVLVRFAIEIRAFFIIAVVTLCDFQNERVYKFSKGNEMVIIDPRDFLRRAQAPDGRLRFSPRPGEIGRYFRSGGRI